MARKRSATTNGSSPYAIRVDAKTIQRLKNHSGDLSSAVLQQLDSSLSWYRQLRPDDRSALGLMAQKGISSFINWLQRPTTSLKWVLTDIFGSAPAEMTRAISLQNALQLIRTVVDVVETKVPELVGEADGALLRDAVLRYSREVAFAAADVYARAAESRGAWDSRLEALVVDAVLRDEPEHELRSRAAAVGFGATDNIAVVIGGIDPQANSAQLAEIRRFASGYASDILLGSHGDRLILLAGGIEEPNTFFLRVGELFGPGPVVYGPMVDSLARTPTSAQAALAALDACKAWPGAPRPVAAADLLPERAMNGDEVAKRELEELIYQPLVAATNGLLETLSTYLDLGHSLEATARELFVHANTVRYRLRRVCDLTGWDPLVPREAFVLQTGLVVGRLLATDPNPA
ncbi:PucR family transcriptional regulator [Micrococcoides hystricis]|uniref:PucR family transcriptional regulator n=1 Tax=Micrococcoides hystricis TaxID=1572761 RepID=A0ABV6PC70_9MICC